MIMNPSAVFGDYTQYQASNKVSLGKSHYHPSEQKKLDDASGRIGLCPHYPDSPMRSELTSHEIIGDKVNNEAKSPKKGLEYLISYIEESSGSSKYDESWPNTEQTSFVNATIETTKDAKDDLYSNTQVTCSTITFGEVTGSAIKAESKEHSVEEFIETCDDNENREGTLSKFIQRFRQQPPLPRRERCIKKDTKPEEFWWLSSSPSPLSPQNSSTPKSSDSSFLMPTLNSLSSGLSDKYPLISEHGKVKESHDVCYEREADSETGRIQQRADRLLGLSESVTKDSSPTPSLKMTAHTKYSDGTTNRLGNGFINLDNRYSNFKYNDQHKDSIEGDLRRTKPLKPEDDILYKWRLSRKMEFAAQAVASKNPFLEHHKFRINTDKSIAVSNYTGKKLKKELTGDNQSEICKIKNGLLESAGGVTHGNDNSHESTNQHVSNIQDCSRVSTKYTNDCLKFRKICEIPFQENQYHPEKMCECCNSNQCRGAPSNSEAYKTLNCSHRPKLYSHSTPHHVHDICDIIPCVHREPTKLPRSHNLLQKKKENNHSFLSDDNAHDIIDQKIQVDKKHESLHLPEHPLEQSMNLYAEKEIDAVKVDVSPVIVEVVSNNLFGENYSDDGLEDDDGYDNSLARDGVKREPSAKVEWTVNVESAVNILEAYCSDDEFPGDEILQELRIRKRKNENELRMVCKQLEYLEK